MKYEFYEAADVAFYNFGIPGFRILDEEHKEFQLERLGSLSGELIRGIVSGLEQVKSGELDHYNFGTDDGIYIYIYTRGKSYKEPDQAGNTYWRKAFTQELVPLSFDDIYNLMRDFGQK